MSKSLWKALLVSPAVVGVMLAVCAGAIAREASTDVEKAGQLASSVFKDTLDEGTPVVPTHRDTKQEELENRSNRQGSTADISTFDNLQRNTDTQSITDSAVVNLESVAQLTRSKDSAELEIAQTPAADEAAGSPAEILEQIEQYSGDSSADETAEQVTNVSQLSDVRPTDWTYEALRSLVERYGCIAGYPDGTYRGNRALSRYEFAAGLNACLTQIEKLIAASTAEFVTKEDLATLQKLVDEFSAELATLRTRVDNLEGRVQFLEDHQFSTTTKLAGEAIFGLASVLTGDNAEGEEIDVNPVLGYRARLNFETSFTGDDLLRARLSTGNFPSFAEETLTPEGDLFFAQPEDNDVSLEVLLYSFPVGKSTEVVLAAAGGAADDFAYTVNPFFDGDGATGALSTFGTRPPIYLPVEGAGIGVRQQFGKNLELSLGYLAGEANDPGEGGGVFNGSYAALAQLVFKPSERFNIGLTFSHAYNQVDTGTGSRLANPQSFLENASGRSVSIPSTPPVTIPNPNPLLPPITIPGTPGFEGTAGEFLSQPNFAGVPLGFSTDIPIISNSYGIELIWQLSDRFAIGGWAGYTVYTTLSTGNGLFSRGDIETFNAAVTLAFPDLGKKGNLGGIVVGIEPKVIDSDIRPNPILAGLGALAPDLGVDFLNFGEDDDTSLHIEAFYQYQVTDNISITPGVIWLTAPDHNSNNQDVVIGVIRTTFSF